MEPDLNGREQIELVCHVIDSQRIIPFFQPIISLRDGTIFGYEALSRVEDPWRPISSDDLFNIASELGKGWQLEQICRTKILNKVKKNEKKFKECKLFLNISPQILVEEMFQAGFDKQYLSRYQVNPESIVFEITEKDSMEEISCLNTALSKYKEQGFEIAIDDLGSCYSGLSLTCEVAPKYIKLDRSLIHDVSKNHSRYILIKSLVEYANSMNIKIIAEGIELEEDLETLIKLAGICITEQEKVIGILTRERFQRLLSGRYGFSLHQYKRSPGKVYRNQYSDSQRRKSADRITGECYY